MFIVLRNTKPHHTNLGRNGVMLVRRPGIEPGATTYLGDAFTCEILSNYLNRITKTRA